MGRESARVCPKCGFKKPETDFGVRVTADGEHAQTYCRDCRAAAARAVPAADVPLKTGPDKPQE